MARIPVTALGGSLYQGKAPSELGQGEYSVLQNWYQHGAKLRRRGGMRRLTNTVFSNGIITGMAHFRPSDETKLIVAGRTAWGYMIGDTFAAITNESGFAIPSSNRRWSMFQYKNVMYGIRDQAGLVRSDGATVGAAGLAAPTVAPTLADGGAGSIPAATFVGVYTFYNPDTDLESNPSPVSTALVLGASKQIAWSAIGVSADPQGQWRRLYRSLPDQSGEFFLVAEIQNNTETTYLTDDVLAEDLGEAASFDNGEPPTGLLMGAVWREILFASDGQLVYHSQDGLIEAFDVDAFIPVDEDAGHVIRAIHAFGDRLIIGKTDRVDYLVGYDPTSFNLLTLTDAHGCVSHHSMQSAEGNLFWLGSDNVYLSNGNTVVGIADLKLRTFLADLDAEAATDAVARVYPALGWYVLSVPGYMQLIYNYRTDVWTEVPTGEDIQTIADFYDTHYAHELYVADDDGHVYRFNDTTYGRDDTAAALGTTITATFDSHAFGAEAATLHVIERAAILCASYSELITLAIVSEGTTIKSREVSLDYEPRWKSYMLSTRHQAKTHSQLRVTYTGETAIELEGFALDISPIGRQSMRAA